MSGARILVAGIGNVFLGDDGFGVALADRLSRLALSDGVKVVDFGIRGMDLAFAMQDGYDAVVLLDATPRGEAPGTLFVIEADPNGDVEVSVDAHGLDPVRVMGLVRALGGVPLTIGVAQGPAKVAPILGALRGHFVNVLVTDVRTAEAVLNLASEAAA